MGPGVSNLRTAFLALGSNLGDRLQQLRVGLERLAAGSHVEVTAASSLYETQPVACAGGPFLNAVVAVRTDLGPRELLRLAKEAETAAGRTGGQADARPLDVDILFFGDERMDDPELTIPHPRVFERGFVMRPLAEVCADAVDPRTGRPIQRLIEAAGWDSSAIEVVAGPEWIGRCSAFQQKCRPRAAGTDGRDCDGNRSSGTQSIER